MARAERVAAADEDIARAVVTKTAIEMVAVELSRYQIRNFLKSHRWRVGLMGFNAQVPRVERFINALDEALRNA